MKKTARSLLALLLCAALLFTSVFSAGALSSEGKPYGTAAQHLLDRVVDKALDFVAVLLTKGLFSAEGKTEDSRFPTAAEYAAADHAGFYRGTDGALTGDGWSLGYAGRSVIPVSWRRNAEGKPDPNGMCLDRKHYFGGYFINRASRIYDDERINLAVLSAGTDRNRNNVQDLVIYAALDNIGISNGTVRTIRLAVQNALAEKGVTPEDILTFQFTGTHAHTVGEALGMSPDLLLPAVLRNHFLPGRQTAVDPELLDTICAQTADAVCEAYDNMERGTLYYFETEDVNAYMRAHAVNAAADSEMIRDKTKSGAAQQNFFACWYFESESGEKTMLSNIGLHPTSVDRDSDRFCADAPYYIGQVMRDNGVNFVFMQGAQAAVGLGHLYTEEGLAWAKQQMLSYEDWVARYGETYAKKHYVGYADAVGLKKNDPSYVEEGEWEYFDLRAASYTAAHFLLDSVDRTNAVEPVVDIRMAETCIPLDYSVIYLAAVSNAFGYNTVRGVDSESGYGIMTEIGYLALGRDTVMLTMPGEVSPALMFGAVDGWDRDKFWQGSTSWTGENWAYDTIEAIAHKALGNDKRILALGLANDEVGYVLPDTDCAENFLTKTILDTDGSNEELMSASPEAGSALVKGYAAFFDGVSCN